MKDTGTDMKDTTNDLSSVLTFRLARAQAGLNAQATRILKKHSELSLVEWRVIRVIEDIGSATLSRLSAEMHMDKGQLSRNVTGMIKKGLMISTPDKHDQRKAILDVTDAGRTILRHLTPIMDERQRRLKRDITADELKVFFDVIAKIEDVVNTGDDP